MSNPLSHLRYPTKYLQSLQAIFLYLAMIYLILMFTNHHPGEVRQRELNFILTLCGGSTKQSNHAACEERAAEVMLKSAVMFTKRKLHFHVIADNLKLFGKLVNSTAGWPNMYRKNIRLSMHNVWFPQGGSISRVCAMQRLFVPSIFPAMKRAIFIDTNILFLRPPEDLWSLFANFSSDHILSLAPSLHSQRSKETDVMYHRVPVLRDGVMLMDLERMRKISSGWVETTMAIYDQHKSSVNMTHQDILNIFFTFYTGKLFELPCEWNYRVLPCTKGNERKVAAIFEAFEHFHLGKESFHHLYEQILAGLDKADRKGYPTKCNRMVGLNHMLWTELEKHII